MVCVERAGCGERVWLSAGEMFVPAPVAKKKAGEDGIVSIAERESGNKHNELHLEGRHTEMGLQQ